MKFRSFIFPFFALGISFGLPENCGEKPRPQETGAPKPGDVVYEIRAVYPHFEEIPRFITAPGTFMASDKLLVKAPLAGVVEKAYVKQGDAVAVGDSLCLFRKEELTAQLAKKQAELREAEATLANTQRTLGIAPSLEAPSPRLPEEADREPVFLDEEDKLPPSPKTAETGFQAEPSYEESLSKVKMLEATISRIQLEVGEIEAQIQSLNVVAPIPGIIQARQITEGSAVSAGEPLFEIVTLNPITLSFFVPQEVSAYVDKFIKVTAIPDVAPEKILEGTVFYISPSVDPSKRTLELRMNVPNEAGIIREGQSGKAFVSTRKMEKVLIAPPEVVKSEGNKNYIYVVAGNKVEKTEVVLGQKSAKGIEINANLRVDDPIVVSPPVELENGSFIKVKETLPLTPIS